MSRLTETQVRQIRHQRSTGATYLVLAATYDVSPGTISAILNGRTWRHLL